MIRDWHKIRTLTTNFRKTVFGQIPNFEFSFLNCDSAFLLCVYLLGKCSSLPFFPPWEIHHVTLGPRKSCLAGLMVIINAHTHGRWRPCEIPDQFISVTFIKAIFRLFLLHFPVRTILAWAWVSGRYCLRSFKLFITFSPRNVSPKGVCTSFLWDGKSLFQPVSGWQTHFHYYPAKNLPLMSKAKESEHSKKDRSGRR